MRRAVLFCVLGLLLATLCLPAGAEEKVLRVGSECAYAPFEFRNEKNEIIGFDIDLIHAIAEEAGLKIEIVDTAFDGIIPGLLAGNFDMAISAMTITEERKKSVFFSDPYFVSGQSIVVREENDDIKVSKDLVGKVVAVQLSTTGQFAVEKIEGVKKILKFPMVASAIQQVLNRAADAAVIDIPVARAFVANNPNAPVKIVQGDFEVEEYGIAIPKRNPELLEKVNKALATLKENGRYDEIYNKWFGN